jgi:hypothetical protein
MLLFDVSCRLLSNRCAANGGQAATTTATGGTGGVNAMYASGQVIVLGNLPVPFFSSTKKNHSKTNAQPPRNWIEDSLEHPFCEEAQALGLSFVAPVIGTREVHRFDRLSVAWAACALTSSIPPSHTRSLGPESRKESSDEGEGATPRRHVKPSSTSSLHPARQ